MIGIFDSGSGGLTVLKAIEKKLPNSDIVYFGDIKNAPYGNKTGEELGALTIIDFEILLDNGATHIISACNSVSANIAFPLFDLMGVPKDNLIEMVYPTVKSFKNKTDKKILLLGTEATIRSGIYQNGFKTIQVKIDTEAIPSLAGIIENGGDEKDIEKTIRKTFAKIKVEYDHVVLGCTHYPLVMDIFEKVKKDLGFRFKIIDPAEFVAKEALKKFGSMKIGSSKRKFIISKDSKFFRDKVSEIMGDKKYIIKVLD
jgi:glutamate racemase